MVWSKVQDRHVVERLELETPGTSYQAFLKAQVQSSHHLLLFFSFSCFSLLDAFISSADKYFPTSTLVYVYMHAYNE